MAIKGTGVLPWGWGWGQTSGGGRGTAVSSHPELELGFDMGQSCWCLKEALVSHLRLPKVPLNESVVPQNGETEKRDEGPGSKTMGREFP